MGLEPTDAAMRRIACVACPSASASLLFCLPHVCSIALLRQLHANREKLAKKVEKKMAAEREYYDTRYGFEGAAAKP